MRTAKLPHSIAHGRQDIRKWLYGGTHNRYMTSSMLNQIYGFDCILSDPVMPGCLGLDALWTIGYFLVWNGNSGEDEPWVEVKFFGPVLPSKKVTYRLNING